MGFNKVFESIKSNWKIILLIGIIVYLVSKGCIEDNYIEKNGIAVTVVVKFYDRLLFNKSGMKTVSGGYYYVDNKRYKCFYRYEIPKGSTFKIKYNPKEPEEWRFVEE